MVIFQAAVLPEFFVNRQKSVFHTLLQGLRYMAIEKNGDKIKVADLGIKLVLRNEYCNYLVIIH